MSPIDLHSHSTASDGLLTPTELVLRAKKRHVTHLALTDHDEIAGLSEAQAAGTSNDVKIISGAELSCLWERKTIHVVGLFLNPDTPSLIVALQEVKKTRLVRGREIAKKLATAGIANAWEGAHRFVTNNDLVSRAHFARFLVDAGYVADQQKAFDRYLSEGKPAFVAPPWPSITQSVAVIHDAGGVAVLAHPGRYRLTTTGRRRLLAEFKDCGGEALEVFSPAHTPNDNEQFIAFAHQFGFAASLGSDFHGDHSRFDLGELPPLPAGVTPVWTLRDDFPA